MTMLLNPFRFGAPVAPAEKLLSLDFKNGVYFKNGVTDTLTNTGVFVGSGATITGGVGATFTGAGYLGFQYDVTSDFIIVLDTVFPSGVTDRTLLDWGSNGNPRANVYTGSFADRMFIGIGNGSDSSSIGVHNYVAAGSPVKVAMGALNGRMKLAIAAEPVISIGTDLAPFTLDSGGGMAIGGLNASGTAWTEPLRSMEVWRVYSDAQISALTAP